MGELLTPFVPTMIAAAEAETHAGLLATTVYFALTLAIMFYMMAMAKKGFSGRVFTNGHTSRFEQLYLFIENMCLGCIGPHGRKYIPMIFTFWMVIFTGSLISLFAPHAPTADFSFNLGMAIIAVFYVQYEGIKANGVFGHLLHFAGPKIGGAGIFISIILFFIEILSELMKNISLSLRLYANIEGGHKAVDSMNHLIQVAPHVFLPFGALLLPLKVLTCVIQSMVFTLLTCVYIGIVTHHESDSEIRHDVPVQAVGA